MTPKMEERGRCRPHETVVDGVEALGVIDEADAAISEWVSE